MSCWKFRDLFEQPAWCFLRWALDGNHMNIHERYGPVPTQLTCAKWKRQLSSASTKMSTTKLVISLPWSGWSMKSNTFLVEIGTAIHHEKTPSTNWLLVMFVVILMYEIPTVIALVGHVWFVIWIHGCYQHATQYWWVGRWAPCSYLGMTKVQFVVFWGFFSELWTVWWLITAIS